MTAHTKVSFVKSGLRGTGYALLLVNIWAAVAVLIVSELIGILEECVI
jgi:hypothetical protein